MSVFRLPVESFSTKENLTGDQQEFDHAITRLFPGGAVQGLPVVGLVPVPLSFLAQDSLVDVTDASIARTLSHGNHHDQELLAWLTITPIPTKRWRANHLKYQEARWHAELHRMWIRNGQVYAGRCVDRESPSWDVAKNPLQDPYRLDAVRLDPEEEFYSPGHGTVTTTKNQLRVELRLDGRPLIHLDHNTASKVQLLTAGPATPSSCLVKNISKEPVTFARVVWRGGEPVRVRPVRDHLSATRHRLLTRAVTQFFNQLYAIRKGEAEYDRWPELCLRFSDYDSVLEALSQLDDRQLSRPALQQAMIRYTGTSQKTQISWPRSMLRQSPCSNFLGDWLFSSESGNVWCPPGVERNHATMGNRLQISTEELRPYLGAWFSGDTDPYNRQVLCWVIAQQHQARGFIHSRLLPDLVPLAKVRTVEILPDSDTIAELPVKCVYHPTWHAWREHHFGIHWDLTPTDSRYIRR